MAWTLLALAGLFEVVWAIGLKYTDGFTRLVPSVITLAGMAISVILLALALRHIPVGTGYAVRTAGVDQNRRGRHRDPRHHTLQ